MPQPMQRSCAVAGTAAVALAKVPAATRAARVFVIGVSLSVVPPAQAQGARTTAFRPAEPIVQAIGLSDFAPVACVRRRGARRHRLNARRLRNGAKDGLCLCHIAPVRGQSGITAVRARKRIVEFLHAGPRWSMAFPQSLWALQVDEPKLPESARRSAFALVTLYITSVKRPATDVGVNQIRSERHLGLRLTSRASTQAR